MTTREQIEQEAAGRWPIKGAPRDSLESARQSYRAGARQGFIAGRTVSKDVDELLRDGISDALLAAPGYEVSDYHSDVVTNIADAVYEHLGLVIEE